MKYNDWNIRDSVGNGKGRRAIEAESLLAGENGSAHKGASGLGHRLQQEIENWKEANTRTEKYRFTGLDFQTCQLELMIL